MTMSRREQLAYLENVRHLETLKWYIDAQLREAWDNQRILKESMTPQKTAALEMSTKVSFVIAACLMLLGAACVILAQVLGLYSFIGFMVRYTAPCFCIVLAIVVAGANGAFEDLATTKRQRREAIAYNAELQKCMPEYTSALERIKAEEQLLTEEQQRVQALLNEAYSFPILPAPYRELFSVIYIHDYMSTSDATLKETLMHAHMEDGIRRVTKRLDMIICQNLCMIRLLREQLLQGAAASAQLQSIASDAKLATHFARVNTYIAQAAYVRS